jgi:hypothetical protein
MIKSPIPLGIRGCLPRRTAAVVNVAAPLAIMALMPAAFLYPQAAGEVFGAMAVLIAAVYMAEPVRLPGRPRPARLAVGTALVLVALGAIALALAMLRPLLAGLFLAALVAMVTLADPLWQRVRTALAARQAPSEWARRADKANRSAGFLPQRTDDELPMLTLAGVRIFAYLDPQHPGGLRVTVDADDADADLDIRGGSTLFADRAAQLEL